MNNFNAKLVINTYDKSIAKVALKALEPDNKITPPDLTISNRIEVDKLIFKVSSSKFERILPTIDEILTSYNALIESLMVLSAEKAHAYDGQINTSIRQITRFNNQYQVP